jgi:hypothetical protein
MTEEEQQLLTALTTKFSDFGVRWNKYQDDEIHDEEDAQYISIYAVAQEFSEYIIDLYTKGDAGALARAFREIENVAQNGSEYMSNAAYVGFIEGVLMLRSHKGIPLNSFDEWLGKGSSEFWYEMHEFFTTGSAHQIPA